MFSLGNRLENLASKTTTHRARLRIAGRIKRAQRAQCRALGCRGAENRHAHNCEAINYHLAMSAAISDTLSADDASRFGAHG